MYELKIKFCIVAIEKCAGSSKPLSPFVLSEEYCTLVVGFFFLWSGEESDEVLLGQKVGVIGRSKTAVNIGQRYILNVYDEI